MNGQLSNLEYIMSMNKMSGRSAKDCSRYPFVPWCLQTMSAEVVKLHETATFRDLSKPLGFMTENERSAGYEE